MPRSRFSLPVAIAMFVVGGLAGALGMAVAQAHGGDTSLVHSCVRNGSGTIRIVGANVACSGSETELDWNIEGVQGPPGTNGTNGVSGYEVKTVNVGPDTSSPKAAIVACSTGKRPLGGGAFPANLGYADSVIVLSDPVLPDSWRSMIRDASAVGGTSTAPWTATFYAVCASVD